MKRCFVTAGLAWGDCGKGTVVDFLTWKYNANVVVRHNGASQCGHNVVTPDGRHHTFQQFGAGTFHPGVRTHLSRFVLINPMNQMREEEHLRELGITDAWERMSVDPRALVIVPFFRELNRALVPAGTNSCGHGVGVCRDFHLKYGDKALFAGDLLDEHKTREKLRFICDKVRETFPSIARGQFNNGDFSEGYIDAFWSWYRDWAQRPDFRKTEEVLKKSDTTIFEGAQGVLLDETHGEEGFNTWTDTTFNNANTLLDEAGFTGERTRVGVIRTYYTRHGAGPFPTEDPKLYFPEPHNEDCSYQGKFRRGTFDYNLFQKAVGIVGGYDMLAINHMDQHLPRGIPTDKPMLIGMGPTYKDRELEPAL